MMKRTIAPSAWGIVGAYLLLFLLVLWPVTDLLVTIWPLRLDAAEWRYSAVGVMAAYLTSPLLAVGLAMVLAMALGQRVVLRSLSIVCAVGAVFLLLALGSLSLDAVQLLGQSGPETVARLRVAAVTSGAKNLFGSLVLLLLAVGAWRTSSGNQGGTAGGEEGGSRHSGLVMRPGKTKVEPETPD